MYDKVLPGKTQAFLALLSGRKVLPPKTYLAGGTACALWLGHRISYDLDYYTPVGFNTENQLAKLDGLNHNFIKTFTEDQTILGDFPEIKFSLFYYAYPLISQTALFCDNTIAGLQDVAAMKINAISDRGAKRDFVDLFFTARKLNFSLKMILELYETKFKALASNQAHILKSLAYFDDAEKDKDPSMLVDWDWQKVKQFFISQIKEFEKENLR